MIPAVRSNELHAVTEYVGRQGAVAQLGEHLLCKQGVNGSIPFSSTSNSIELFPDRCRSLMILYQADVDQGTGCAVRKDSAAGFR